MIDRIHGGNIQPYLKDKSSSFKNKLIDFSASINPLGLPSRAKEVILKNLNTLIHYPQAQSKELKNALSTFHNINQNNILVGNGSIELIHLIPRALKVKNALIITPTFSEYEFAVRLSSAHPIFVRLKEKDNFKINSTKIKRFISKVDLIFFCNPNNPTGSLLPRSDILPWLDLCKQYNTVLVIDEVFMDFVEDSKKETLTDEAVRNIQLIILKSLTKFFALPGLRLGYLIAHQSLINKISQFQYPWNVNSLAQAVACEVIKDKDYIEKGREFILKERAYLFENFKKIKGLKVYSPTSNFVFCKLENSHLKSSIKLHQRLIEKGIIIRSCYNFRGLNDSFFRVAVRTRKENIRLILSLKETLK